MAKLLLSDEEHSKDPWPAIAGIWRVDRQQQRIAGDLDAMAAEIARYDSLEELVLCYHGFTGGIMIDDQGYNLSDAEIKKAFTKKKTKIERIRFEGCWVGQAPDEMLAFGKLFGSSTVSAFTWVGWTETTEFTIPKGATAEGIKKVTAPYEKWFIPNSLAIPQLNSMARQGGKQKVGLLWYQRDLTDHAPYLGDNYKKFGAITYKARTEASPRTVEAKDAKTNYSPAPPFEYVTVKL